jgi:hypothetical protein
VLEALEETARLYPLIQPSQLSNSQLSNSQLSNSQLSDSQIAELRTHFGARW